MTDESLEQQVERLTNDLVQTKDRLDLAEKLAHDNFKKWQAAMRFCAAIYSTCLPLVSERARNLVNSFGNKYNAEILEIDPEFREPKEEKPLVITLQ